MEKVCYICRSLMDPVFSGRILKKYWIQYFRCPACGYVCTEDPYWLDESYKTSINLTDTGLIARNIHASEFSSCVIFLFLKKDLKGLDYGGGYGILTRLMRDIGFEFYWWDPYTTNLFAKGFEYPGKDCSIEVVTAFENFEHFVHPLDDLGKIFSISHNVIFSTVLLPDPLPVSTEWWYYGLEHGQHISFYSEKTLRTIADKFGVNYYTYQNLHFFTPKKINRAIWLITGKFGTRFIIPIIKFMMKSRTIEDMNNLKNDQKEIL